MPKNAGLCPSPGFGSLLGHTAPLEASPKLMVLTTDSLLQRLSPEPPHPTLDFQWKVLASLASLLS